LAANMRGRGVRGVHSGEKHPCGVERGYLAAGMGVKQVETQSKSPSAGVWLSSPECKSRSKPGPHNKRR